MVTRWPLLFFVVVLPGCESTRPESGPALDSIPFHAAVAGAFLFDRRERIPTPPAPVEVTPPPAEPGGPCLRLGARRARRDQPAPVGRPSRSRLFARPGSKRGLFRSRPGRVTAPNGKETEPREAPKP